MQLKSKKNSWRPQLIECLGLLGGVGAGLAGVSWTYARFVEPYWLQVTRHSLQVADLGLAESWRGFRVAFLSDLHMGRQSPPLRTLQDAVSHVLAERPDLVLLGGDYFTRGTWNPAMGDLVRKMTSQGLPVVAALGNHDYFGRRGDPQRIKQGFEQAGACVLVNRATPIDYKGQREWLAVIDDLNKGEPDLLEIAKDLPEGVRPLILLCHNPDYVCTLPPDYCRLMISGHTHGGQINFAPPPFQERLNWIRFTRTQHYSNFPLGWYQVNGIRLYVGRGLGLSGFRLRFNSRPELPIFEFV